MGIDFKNMQTYHYFLIIGGGILVLAVALYAFAGRKARLPAMVACGLSCLVVGFGAGVLVLGSQGYNWNAKSPDDEVPVIGANGGGGGTTEQPPGPKMPPPPGKMPMGKGGPAAKGGVEGKGGGGPSPKIQLVALVNKLSQLTDKRSR